MVVVVIVVVPLLLSPLEYCARRSASYVLKRRLRVYHVNEPTVLGIVLSCGHANGAARRDKGCVRAYRLRCL